MAKCLGHGIIQQNTQYASINSAWRSAAKNASQSIQNTGPSSVSSSSVPVNVSARYKRRHRGLRLHTPIAKHREIGIFNGKSFFLHFPYHCIGSFRTLPFCRREKSALPSPAQLFILYENLLAFCDHTKIHQFHLFSPIVKSIPYSSARPRTLRFLPAISTKNTSPPEQVAIPACSVLNAVHKKEQALSFGRTSVQKGDGFVCAHRHGMHLTRIGHNAGRQITRHDTGALFFGLLPVCQAHPPIL